MKILLVSINAKYIHTNNAVRLLKANSDFEMDIFEYTIKDNHSDIIHDIQNYQPDVLGFSVYIWNVSMILELIHSLQLTHTTVVLGGPEVSYEPEFFLGYDGVDIIIKGEGEFSFNELLHALNNQMPLDDISNISFMKNQNLISNPITEIKDLTRVVLPYYFEEDKKHITHKISYIESSRGCPYKCSYCLSSLEKTVRFFDVNQVKKAIMYLMENGSKTIKFLDRTFNANKNTLEILNFIIQNNDHKTVFQFEITGDILDIEIIDFLNQNAPRGLFRFEIGIQSTNEQTNRLVDRFQNTEKLFRNIKRIQEHDIIDLHLDLIAGLPLEDISSFKKTFNRVFQLGAKELQLGFLKMLRGTKIRKEASIYKYQFDNQAPYQVTENNVLSASDIQVIHDVEHMLELYHNKGYFGEELHKIILGKKDPFSFFYEIHLHYMKHNFKMKKYQIEDIYQNLFPMLTSTEQFLVKKDYLNRSNIKPKLFFETVKDKEKRKLILEKVHKFHHISLHELYKHSVIIQDQQEFFIIVYQHNQKQSFTIKEDS